jgi:hypothetical protein
MSQSARSGNPFEFGRELSLDELVDRETDLQELRDVLTTGGIPISTMQKAVAALVSRQIVREDLAGGSSRLGLEDPLFGTWLRTTIEWP